MTSGEGKKFWRRFDAISPKRRAAEFQVTAAVAIRKPQRRSRGPRRLIDKNDGGVDPGSLVVHRRVGGHGGRRGCGRQHSIEYANDLPDIDQGGVRYINEIAIGHPELLLDEEAVRISQIEPVDDRDLVSPRWKRHVQLQFSRDRGIFV